MKEQQKQKAITALLVLLLAIVAVNQYMLLSVSAVPRLVVLQGTQQTSQVQQQTSQPVLQAAPSQVGIPYNEQGYQQLLGYDSTIKLSDAQMKDYVGLNILLPCCGFPALQAQGNCQCGHHVAMSGMAKYMISKGYSRDQVQAELNNWKEVFYPGSGASSGGSLGGC